MGASVGAGVGSVIGGGGGGGVSTTSPHTRGTSSLAVQQVSVFVCVYVWLSYRRSLLAHWLVCVYVCMYDYHVAVAY